MRYRFWPVLTSFGPFLPYLGIFEHFRSSERYKIYETLIDTHDASDKIEGSTSFLVFRKRGSRDIEFDPPSGPFYPILGIFLALLVI